MPELPEVETTVRDLRKKIIGKKISSLWTDWPKALKGIELVDLENKIKGSASSKIERRGKNILIQIGKVGTLLIHLKMTGHLLYRPQYYFNLGSGKTPKVKKGNDYFLEKVNQYIHFRILFNDKTELAFSDLRKFGRIKFSFNLIGDKLYDEHFSDLGEEPFDKSFNEAKLRELLESKRNKGKEIKVLLMDQAVISGIGNIYASEILFDAKINPRKKAGSLSKKEASELFKSIQRILNLAIKKRGTSVSDYRDPAGKSGSYGLVRKVYKRKGDPCFRCKATVESFKQGQRSTFWCPRCQK